MTSSFFALLFHFYHTHAHSVCFCVSFSHLCDCFGPFAFLDDKAHTCTEQQGGTHTPTQTHTHRERERERSICLVCVCLAVCVCVSGSGALLESKEQRRDHTLTPRQEGRQTDRQTGERERDRGHGTEAALLCLARGEGRGAVRCEC
mmetsp:Transcript_52693/g.132458  ORF Transcript_52693/g.132458 Transcript_52693/m.132458 type:complete len:147 (+) Transcript_52693:658-1098(+)